DCARLAHAHTSHSWRLTNQGQIQQSLNGIRRAARIWLLAGAPTLHQGHRFSGDVRMRRIVPIAFAAVLCSLFATQAARANDADPADKAAKDPVITGTTPGSEPAAASEAAPAPAAQQLQMPALRLSVAPKQARPMSLPALYGGLIALQGYDVYSTE